MAIEGDGRSTGPGGAPPYDSSWRGSIIPEVLSGVVVFHLGALLAFIPYFFTWTGVVVAFVLSQVFGYVMSVGFHRYFAHRSFTCPKPFEYVLAVLCLLCVQRGPAWWAATHRRHHHCADTEFDPHNPRPSFLWAHLGWFLFLNDNTDPRLILKRYAGDLMKDPFYAWLETGSRWILFVLAFTAAIFAAGVGAKLLLGASMAEAVRLGCSLVVWGVFVRTVVVWHVTWSSASCSHLWGYRTYDTGDDSRNNWLLRVMVMGEGWANNHHAFPQSPRLTVRWWEFDQSWLVIKALAWAGLAKVDPTTFPRREAAPAQAGPAPRP